MDSILKSNSTYSREDIWLFISISAYFLMNGAQLWETFIMVPAWTAAPPASLHFFQGPYGLDFKAFWIIVHSIHDVLFLMAIIFNWKIMCRRKPMLILFFVHACMRAWTLLYFAPVLMEFQAIPVSNTIEEELVHKAALWQNLNYLRVGVYFAVNIALIPLFKIKNNIDL